MRVREARLVIRAARRSDFPREGIPEVAFVGRSNVGKSGLLNALVGQHRLARMSGTPGCTRLIHFYLLDQRLLFVDLPGYGYARAPRSVRAQWRPLVESYLVARKPLGLVWVLLDARHPPTAQDRQLLHWLQAEGIPWRTVFTKTDKLSQQGRSTLLRRFAEEEVAPQGPVPILSSARKGTGIQEVWREISRQVLKDSRGPTGSIRQEDGSPRGTIVSGV